ncbi:SPOR domain-containing protein [Methylibium sp.]|uniref:SPOR domain-containing protein n=1 Tax=Methylibium sp. TaxID=2067992 RepID=UPI003D0E10E0
MPFFPFPRRSSQRGGFIVGLIVGLLVGLALALGVALYVTKVPIPFINKVPQRTVEQDAAEAERNRNWDPNTPLYGKKPAAGAASSAGAPAASGPTAALPKPAPDARDPAAILGGGGPAKPGPDLSTTGSSEAFVYFVQVGAYARTEEAEAQRAKLAIQGFESKITEREQSGRTMYRVRVGPFTQRTDAEKVKETLDGAGAVSALVRVQK